MLWAFVVGSCVGSFLNVVVYRLPRGESLITPGSRCPWCSTALGLRDNLPLLSFAALRGRCRFCGAPISWRYPLVELGMALVAVAIHRTAGQGPEAILTLVGLAALVAAALIDLDTFVIPDALCIALLGAGVGLAWFSPPALGNRVMAGVAGWCVLTALAILTGGMGLGDAKLLGAMGVFLGVQGVALAFFVAVLVGAGVGVGLMVVGKGHRRDPVPFGPFLALGGVAAALGGQDAPAATWKALGVLSVVP